MFPRLTATPLPCCLAVVLAFAAALPASAGERAMDDDDLTNPRRKSRSSSGSSIFRGGHHFRSSDPEATLGIGAYAFWVAPKESRAVTTKGGGMDISALLMIPFERDSDFAMIAAFRQMYGGFTPAGFHFDLRFSLGLALGLGPFAAGPFVGVGIDGMARLDSSSEGADFPRVPSAAQAHYGAVLRFVPDKELIVEATAERDTRTCSDVTQSDASPFEVCELTRIEGRVQLLTSRDAGVFAALRWDAVGHSNVWGISIGVAPNPR